MTQGEAAADAEYAERFHAFVRDLRALHIAHGKPTLREVQRYAPDGRSLSASAVSEVLNGKRLPSIDFLIALVRTLLGFGEGHDHRQVSRTDPRLDEWRATWRELALLATGLEHPVREPAGSAPEGPDVPADSQVPAPTPAAAPGRPVRIFVAMPGAIAGTEAQWRSIPEIRRWLLVPAAERIGQLLGRETELVIEKEKTSAGTIHRSMFREAVDADVYLADLTGANANVYLELGVRWALHDGVTLLICQETSPVLFNASYNRVIPYGATPDALEEAISRIAASAVEGLRDPHRIDSPVREGATFVTVRRAAYEALRADLARLREHQAEDLIDAALRSGALERRIALLQQAVQRNPVAVRAYHELGVALRRASRYEEAEAALRTCVELRDDSAGAWRDLGLTLSLGGGDNQGAVEAFERTVALDETDAETWATLGGLRRRLARREAPDHFDVPLLEAALACYRTAARLKANDTYPLLNMARIELLLAGLQGTSPASVIDRFRQLEHLARFAASDSGGTDPWKLFDLADTLLLTGRGDEGLAEIRKAVSLVPAQERASVLRTVLGPLQDLLAAPGLLPERTTRALRTAVAECEAALSPPA
jgi:tetratricopeptide (TPR) repeat protein